MAPFFGKWEGQAGEKAGEKAGEGGAPPGQREQDWGSHLSLCATPASPQKSPGPFTVLLLIPEMFIYRGQALFFYFPTFS